MPGLKKLKIAMLVVDAKDHSSLQHRDYPRQSPVLHSAIHNLLDGLKERNDVEVEVIYGARNATSRDERRDGCIRYIPVAYRPLPVPGIGGPYVARTLALLRHIKSSNPDVVHAQGTERESGIVAAMTNRPSLVTLHGNFREISKAMNASWHSYLGICALLQSYTLPRVSGVLCLSEHTRRSVELSAKRHWTLPNAASVRFFNIQRFPSSAPRILCIAGIAPWKNPMALVMASDKLHNAFPDATIHFHGDCNPEDDYGKSFLEAIRTRPWCISHGQSSETQIIEALSTATCCILPSIMENCPMCVIESMAAGVPVIGANVGGIPDLIADGETGYIFDPHNVEQLASLMIELHTNLESGAGISQRANMIASERFSPEVIAEAHVGIYHELLKS